MYTLEVTVAQTVEPPPVFGNCGIYGEEAVELLSEHRPYDPQYGYLDLSKIIDVIDGFDGGWAVAARERIINVVWDITPDYEKAIDRKEVKPRTLEAIAPFLDDDPDCRWGITVVHHGMLATFTMGCDTEIHFRSRVHPFVFFAPGYRGNLFNIPWPGIKNLNRKEKQ